MKKFLAVMLMCTLCLGLFSACSRKSGDVVKETVKVDQNATVTEDASGTKVFNTITDAVTYFETAAFSDDTIKCIEIAAGTYGEKVYIKKTLKNVRLIGATDGVTKISYGDYAGRVDESGNAIGTDNTATLTTYSEGFQATNIYFENSFDYLNSTESAKQALAVYCRADKVIFENCTFTGYQDTLEVVEGRQYFKNCTIKGCVDFIFGNNPAVLFDNCDIITVNRNQSNGGYVTAMKGNNGTNGVGVATYGLVFKNCRLTAENGVRDNSVALGRPWRADATVAWINCEMGSHIGLNAFGSGKVRYASMSGGGQTNLPKDAHFAEFGNTGTGAVTEATDDFTMLTAEQAALYTPANIFATKNGDVTYEGEWNPVG